MKQTAYVILQTEWQYNDEYYFRDTEGGLPHRAFFDKAKADAECEKQNILAARKTFSQFLGEEGFWRVKDPALRERLQLTDDDWYEYQIPKSASDADVLALVKTMKMEFFVVKTVDVE